ncbi:MAG: HD domain-containing protein [Candidatus Thorarchaeota archaeon]|nr:MAG: hypothetical protein DRP09_06235 [Candidatus Thorarchaeota archaeon]RLI59960.1 MAG: hypothetical protein DRO87_01255 [Candidatus Thorarchaeota archaeon]
MLKDINPNIVNLIRLTGFRESYLKEAEAHADTEWAEVQSILNEHHRFVNMGGRSTRQKAIQDPIHGAILFDPWELDVMSTPEMLRLRSILQLGPAHLVYPGATHTRFQHCLGTDFLAQKSIRVVNYCDDIKSACFVPVSTLLDDYHQRLFRASALLHDVGHPPTSHTIEFALESWAGVNHADLGEFLILNSGLAEVLEHHDIAPSDIVSVLRGTASDPVMSLLTDFLDHPLDIDKTDYLIRDAHFSGVQLGIFPAERVMLTNRIVREPDGRYVRAFMLKAIHSLEALILSRNWMHLDLYLHHAVKMAEALISKATYFRLEEEDLSENEVVGQFTRMVDSDLFRWLSESEIPFVREYVSRIRYRRLLKVALARPLASFDSHIRETLLDTIGRVDRLVEIEESLSDEPGSVILDIVVPKLGEAELSKIPLLVDGEGGLDIVPLNETKEGHPLVHLLEQQARTIPSVRVYCAADIEASVRRRFDREFPMSEESAHHGDE